MQLSYVWKGFQFVLQHLNDRSSHSDIFFLFYHFDDVFLSLFALHGVSWEHWLAG